LLHFLNRSERTIREKTVDIIFPWFKKIWQQLLHYKQDHLVPSAILFSGPSGMGKLTLAKEFAKLILCKADSNRPCASCRSCVLFEANTHPDFYFIYPEEKNTAIKIDQIRELTDALAQTSSLGGYQVALISLAEEMNKSAANALLKTLEEPRGNVLIILISNQPSMVTATILSRCQHIKLPLANKNEASEWLNTKLGTQGLTFLRIADNLPLKALSYAEQGMLPLRDSMLFYLQAIREGTVDPIQAAADCLNHPLERLQFLMTLVLDIIRIKFSVNDHLNHCDQLMPLKELGCSVSFPKLFKFLEELVQAIEMVMKRSNANLQLLMEKIFIYWRYDNEVS
jgi:DNA polymerase III subunit delta'